MNVHRIQTSTFVAALFGALFFCASIFSSTSPLHAQSGEFMEEIQTIPEGGKTGEWTFGGQKVVADDETRFAFDHPADVGAMAEVEFRIADGVIIATEIAPQNYKASEVFDGPHVLWSDEKTAQVLTLRNGDPELKTHEDVTEPLELDGFPGMESTIVLNPANPEPPQADWEAPSKLLAISDLEGNYLHALRFLQNNEVLDDDGHWQWGDGHLVLVGDLVDRGAQVTELMWMMHRLEREANAAGGHVHYILGNHEAMVMGGDVRYVHLKYSYVCNRLRIPYHQLYSEQTEIGRWWRSKNAVERVGDLLFVHGGYSPLLDEAGLTIDELNQRVREGLPPASPAGNTPELNPVGHQHGPFWYRGYFDKHAAQWGGKATAEQVGKILERHNAKHVVIGHTVVEHVGPLDETGQVIGIDTKWADAEKCEGLLYIDGSLYRLTMTGERESLDVGASR